MRKLKSLYFNRKISAGGYESRKKELYAIAREEFNSPVVLIHVAEGTTLSTVAAAITLVNIAEIPNYYIVTPKAHKI